MLATKSKILYVDDESINLRSFKSLFRKKYDITTVESGREALEILATEPIDILVTDQMMPEMTGLELLRIVSKQHPDVLMMILTGYSEMSVIKEAVNECGIYCYLNKPWERDLLERTFDRALEHQKLIKERENMISQLNKSNENLEEMVQERTKQIELQRDELVNKNSQLEVAKDTIHKKNDQLRIYNQDLELQVQERTRQLSDSNLQLQKYNEQLQQFAFLAAHNFRGPVASLLGLIQLFEMDKSKQDHEGYKDIFGNVKQMALKLDDVIKDLSEILHEKTNRKLLWESVNLNRAISRVENALNAQIVDSGTQIHKNFDSNYSLKTDSSLLEGVIYELIANAIKFRKKDVDPEISISVVSDDNKAQIRLTDNCLGIDLETYEEKVFGVYQTFHEGYEGKGLGLFSARTTIHKLGGNIHVRSKPNQGTEFIIDLPVR
ncbi:MAG: signal transduction histidine kinase [Flammeovirgaceae bacterium]|jgi:signal transduction histidine kinase